MLSQFNRYEMSVILLTCVFICLFLYYLYRSLAKLLKKGKINRRIRKISAAVLKDVELDMGDDQYAFFEYIVLLADRIMIIEIKDFAGHIFASEQINQWTQILSGKSYKFSNPFFELERKTDLLKHIVPADKLGGMIVFTDNADFPKGRPQNVWLLGELTGIYGKVTADEATTTIRDYWLQLNNYLQAQRDV